MTKLNKFCRYTPLKVLGISTIIAFISAFIIASVIKKDARETMYLMIYPMIIIPNILFSVGSYSIYFNLYNKVRKNIWLCLLSFYFPVVIAAIIMALNGIMGLLSAPLLAIPFLTPQTYYFVRFRKRLKTGEILDDFYCYPIDNNQVL